MDFGFNLGYTKAGSNTAVERLYAINEAGEQEPVYDADGEPIYLKRES
jgi:hypothetical protein